MNADGYEVIFHSADPTHHHYCAAIEVPWDGAVQPYHLVRAILSQSGAELVYNNEVYRIVQESPDYVDVYTRQFIFRARHVLLCTNAYSYNLDPYFVGKVIPTRGQCLVTAPLKEHVFNACGYSDYGYMYYRETFDGRLLIGGGRKQNKPLENDTTDDRITDPVQRILDGYLKQWFPEVNVPVEQRWAGIMGFSVDGLPLVGILPDKPRVGFAVGFTGHGLSSGAGVAERAVDLLLNGVAPGAVSAARLLK
jgi:glycine/D-amino acid oxidase-like deaminating enzyme